MRLLLAALSATVFAASVNADVSPDKVRQAAAKIDTLLAEHWKTVGVPTGDPISNETFVRRVYLDLAGRIPTPAETTAFLGSAAPDKRAVLVRDLLGREGYVSHFYHFWADLLRVKSSFSNTSNVVPAAYIAYLKESLRANKPYDRLVYELLSARGWRGRTGQSDITSEIRTCGSTTWP